MSTTQNSQIQYRASQIYKRIIAEVRRQAIEAEKAPFHWGHRCLIRLSEQHKEVIQILERNFKEAGFKVERREAEYEDRPEDATVYIHSFEYTPPFVPHLYINDVITGSVYYNWQFEIRFERVERG